MTDTPPDGFAPLEPAPVVPRASDAELRAYPPPAAFPQRPPTTPADATPVPTSTAGRSWTPWIVAASVAVGVGLVTLAVVGIVAIGNLASSIPESLGESETASEDADAEYYVPELRDLVDGEPGPSTAASPDDCVDPCFGPSVLGETIAADSAFAGMHLRFTDGEWGDFASMTPAEEHLYTAESWNEAGASPAACYFSYFASPVVAELDEIVESDDRIDYTVARSTQGGYSSIQQAVRVFDTTAEADEHMARLAGAIEACPAYRVDSPEAWERMPVSAAPALDLPASIASVGWREESEYGRYYVYDLQRANIVVRTILTTDGEITETAFRDMIGVEADLMADFEIL